MSEKEIKRRKTFVVRLTKFELLHLRDLFSVALPPEMKETLSQRLAQSQERVLVESKLWQKLVLACSEAGLPMGDDAPDFVVSASGAPPIGVFELAHEPATQDSDDEGTIFDSEDEEDEDEDE
jgi:hypothetical protein